MPGCIGAAAGAGFSADGWLQTGDLGAADPRGFITLKGRQKDMSIQGGFNVYPAEVEAVLARHPQVVMAALRDEGAASDMGIAQRIGQG